MLPKKVFLTGFMGAGKSSIGLKLAARLNIPFLDTDTLIEQQASMSIAAIFQKKGEAHFRELERTVCTSLGEPGVVALGGGAFMNADTRNHLKKTGLTVFLQWPFDVLYTRIAGDSNRPLSRSRSQLSTLYKDREHGYLLADLVWQAKPPYRYSPDEAAEEIQQILLNRDPN